MKQVRMAGEFQFQNQQVYFKSRNFANILRPRPVYAQQYKLEPNDSYITRDIKPTFIPLHYQDHNYGNHEQQQATTSADTTANNGDQKPSNSSPYVFTQILNIIILKCSDRNHPQHQRMITMTIQIM